MEFCWWVCWKCYYFGVDNSSSIHNNNRKNSFSELVEESNGDINDSIVGAKKKVSINFKTTFCIAIVVIRIITKIILVHFI